MLFFISSIIKLLKDKFSLYRSIFFNHSPDCEDIPWIYWRNSSNKLSLFEFLIFISYPPWFSVSIVWEGSINHINSNSEYIASFERSPIFGSSWVTIMSQLPIINTPAINCIAESALKFYIWTTNSYFKQLSFIDKQLEIISWSCLKYLCSEGGFESWAIFWCACCKLLV